MKFEYIVYGILAVIVLGRFVMQIRQTTSGHVLTGRATVVSRRVEHGDPRTARRNAKTWYVNSSWNYLVTFRLSDGEEIELYTFENDYKSLKEGLTGQLRWHKDSMTGFEPDMEVTL